MIEQTTSSQETETGLATMDRSVSDMTCSHGTQTIENIQNVQPGETEQEREYRHLMRKFWFAAAIAVPVLALSYPDLIPGLRDWMPAGSLARSLVWGMLGLLTLPVLLWSGSQFYTGMWSSLKHRSANMHTLIALGVSAAFLYSAAWS